MARAVAVASQKGGVGKTTTAIHLGAALARANQSVLLVDLDPQGNATSALGVEAPTRNPLPLLFEGSLWTEAIARTQVPGLSVLPALRAPDVPLRDEDIRAARIAELRRDLDTSGAWDWILFDCPPSFGPLSRLALVWADAVLVPVQCEYLAMEGLAQMLELIARADRMRARPLEIEGILLTLFSPDLHLSIEVVEEVRRYFPEHVLDTIIPRDVALAEAASHGEPVFRYAPRSKGAWAYLNLAKEILEHECAQAG